MQEQQTTPIGMEPQKATMHKMDLENVDFQEQYGRGLRKQASNQAMSNLCEN